MTSSQHGALWGGIPRSRGAAQSAVLVLHGGRESSVMPTNPLQPAFLRMIDMYVGLRRHSQNAAVYLLRHRVRGWNAPGSRSGEPDPVSDAREALDQISERHPGVDIVLLGHSMGGRTAFAVADDPRVVGICALAPWLPAGEPIVARLAGQRFVIAHGTADRMTSPPGSLQYAERLLARGATVARFELDGEKHALLGRPILWNRFAVRVSLGLSGDTTLPSAVSQALQQPRPDNVRLALATSSYR